MDACDYSDCSDESLMVRYADGDPRAFETLFLRYETRVYGYFLRRLRSESQAADLYQELFLRIHCARSRYDPTRPFAPWSFQIARRLLIDEFRRAGRRHEQVLEEDLRSGLPIEWKELAPPEWQATAHEEARRALGQLSDVERYVLVSAKVDGRQYRELAAELGKSVAAIKKLASRAMQRLRVAHETDTETALPARI
jgi:RNA polymerase sigma-70 factor, ECF subfamily